MDEEKFIDVKKIIESKNPRLAKWIPGFIIAYLKRILHQREINQFIIDNKDYHDVDFCMQVVKFFQVSVDLINKENIPKDGKIVLAMNHPMGGVDAMAIVAALKGHREDLKFIVNDILLHLKNLNGIFVGVDKHRKNGPSQREQLVNLFQSDSAICIFPAGLVSRKINGEIMDLDWKKTFVTLSKQTDRTIIPIHIHGGLSNFFYGLSKLRKFLGIKANIEMLYLSNEFFKFKNKHIRIVVGKPIPASSLPQNISDRAIAELIKKKVYELA